MRDTLPKKIHHFENGIVNLDTNIGEGTHWIAYSKKDKNVTYFDSYGSLPPPLELINYFLSNGFVDITYNYDKFQTRSYTCGHHSLNFLYNQNM